MIWTLGPLWMSASFMVLACRIWSWEVRLDIFLVAEESIDGLQKILRKAHRQVFGALEIMT